MDIAFGSILLARARIINRRQDRSKLMELGFSGKTQIVRKYIFIKRLYVKRPLRVVRSEEEIRVSGVATGKIIPPQRNNRNKNQKQFENKWRHH